MFLSKKIEIEREMKREREREGRKRERENVVYTEIRNAIWGRRVKESRFRKSWPRKRARRA